MANLYGRLFGDAGKPVTRTAPHDMTSRLETWEGEIKTELLFNGNFRVYIGTKGGADILIATGNVNDGQRSASLGADADAYAVGTGGYSEFEERKRKAIEALEGI